LPDWSYITEQSAIPLVIVTVPPEIEQPPGVVIATGNPELDVAATAKLEPVTADDGAAVVTVMDCAALVAVVVDVTVPFV